MRAYEVVGTGILVAFEDDGPSAAAVGRLVDATIAAGPEEWSNRRDEHDVVIRGIDDDAIDVLGVAKAHVLERRSAVGRFVNAVAPRGALAVVRFAGADPNEVRFRLGDGEGADR